MHRICKRCNQQKDLELFYPHAKGKFGRKAECKECEKAKEKERRSADVGKARAYGRDYYAANADTLRKAANDNNDTPKNRIDNVIAGGISRRIVNGGLQGKIAFELIGVSFEELKKHLESQFTETMSWDNYGFHGWHIDHKKPLSCFTYSTQDDAQFKEAWSLGNLQPLWSEDNWSKGSRVAA